MSSFGVWSGFFLGRASAQKGRTSRVQVAGGEIQPSCVPAEERSSYERSDLRGVEGRGLGFRV